MLTPSWEPIAGKLQLVLSGEAGASKAAFPSWGSRRYTQV